MMNIWEVGCEDYECLGIMYKEDFDVSGAEEIQLYATAVIV
jgi:hypothetical protein